jgi:predicted transcriptional regulator
MGYSEMKVRDIMHQGVMTVEATAALQQVTSFFIEHGITGAPVVGPNGAPVGVISMSDLTAHAAGLDKPKEGAFLRELWSDDSHASLRDLTFDTAATAGDVMTEFLIRIDADAEVRELLELMKTARLHRVFVTDKDKLVGIVTTLDLVVLLDRLLAERSA